jgi:hypothetical protein
VFAATWIDDPGPLARDLTALKFHLLKAGPLDRDSFHATEDLQTLAIERPNDDPVHDLEVRLDRA